MVAKGAAVPLGGASGWLGVVCGWCWGGGVNQCQLLWNEQPDSSWTASSVT